MTTVTFDTLEYSNTLQEAGFSRQQAEAMAKAQNKALQEMVSTKELATKADLAATKHELIKWMFAFFIAQNAIFVGLLAFMK